MATVTILIFNPVQQPITVSYSTASGSATAGEDFTPVSGGGSTYLGSGMATATGKEVLR